MKFITLFTILLTVTSLQAQFSEVQFREQHYDNGMTYPEIVIPGEQTHSDSINADLQRRIYDLKESDFCIGQYGYVQKSTHLQVHIFCNCIDFEESQNRFFLYNIEEGASVPYSDLFDPKKVKDAGKFLADQTKAYCVKKGITLSEDKITEIANTNLDAFKTEMTKSGVNLWLEDIEAWGKEPFQIPWTSLKPYLKYHFI